MDWFSITMAKQKILKVKMGFYKSSAKHCNVINDSSLPVFLMHESPDDPIATAPALVKLWGFYDGITLSYTSKSSKSNKDDN